MRHGNDEDRLALSATEVAKSLGISKSQLQKLVSRDQFPKPLYFGRMTPRWPKVVVENFLKSSN